MVLNALLLASGMAIIENGFRFSFVFTYQLYSNKVKLISFACAENTTPGKATARQLSINYLNFNNFPTEIIFLYICFMTASQPVLQLTNCQRLAFHHLKSLRSYTVFNIF